MTMNLGKLVALACVLGWNLGCGGTSGGGSGGSPGAGASSGGSPSGGASGRGSSRGGAGSGGQSGEPDGGSGGAAEGFVELEILGEFRHYATDAEASTHGTAEGYIAIFADLDGNPSKDSLVMYVLNQTGTFAHEAFWFSSAGFYAGPVDVQIVQAAPEVGDVIKGTFSGELMRTNDEGDIQPLTRGRFELTRTE